MAKKKYYQRPDGLYESIRRINGKRVAFRGKTCREVDRKILEYAEKAEQSRTFPEIAREWEKAHEKEVGYGSIRTYAASLRRQKEYFSGEVRPLRPLDIQRYITSLEKQGFSRSTITRELSVLRMVLAHAVLAGDIDVNPAAEVKASRGLPGKKREALTEEQEAIVRETWKGTPFGLFALFLLYSGLRKGEALALSYSDIDRKAGVIRVNKKLNYSYGNRPHLDPFTKTANGMREVPLLRPLADALPKNRVGLIFPGKDGGFMPDSEFCSGWRRYCEAVGLDGVTPHCFRHSFATICYEAGLDLRQAAKIVGDTPEVLGEVYTHLREGQRQTGVDKLVEYVENVR